MRGGKKSVAERIVYGAFDQIGKKVKDKTPLEVLQAAMENVKTEAGSQVPPGWRRELSGAGRGVRSTGRRRWRCAG